MGLKIKPEIQISFSSVLEALVVFDIATRLMGFSLNHNFKSHFFESVLRQYVDSRHVRIRLLDGDIRLVHSTSYGGVRFNLQQFIEYAAKQ